VSTIPKKDIPNPLVIPKCWGRSPNTWGWGSLGIDDFNGCHSNTPKLNPNWIPNPLQNPSNQQLGRYILYWVGGGASSSESEYLFTFYCLFMVGARMVHMPEHVPERYNPQLFPSVFRRSFRHKRGSSASQNQHTSLPSIPTHSLPPHILCRTPTYLYVFSDYPLPPSLLFTSLPFPSRTST